MGESFPMGALSWLLMLGPSGKQRCGRKTPKHRSQGVHSDKTAPVHRVAPGYSCLDALQPVSSCRAIPLNTSLCAAAEASASLPIAAAGAPVCEPPSGSLITKKAQLGWQQLNKLQAPGL